MKHQLNNINIKSLAILAAALAGATNIMAASVRTDAAFYANTLAANDDGSTSFVNFGFANALNFFGESYSGGWVNNNGNVTFDSAMATFTPFPILATGRPMIAPFFGDVDTRGAASGLLHYGGGTTVDGRPAWGASWQDVGGVGVGYYAGHTDKLNNFQLVIIDRSDIALGDFDFEFNYDQIQWETGDASDGVGGLGGTPARAGYSNGSSVSYEIPGAGISGAYLDGGPNSLSDVGRFTFQVRNGIVIPPPSVPDAGSSLALLGLGAAAIAGVRQSIRK